MRVFFFFYIVICPIFSFSQGIKISGAIKDKLNAGIENASVVIYSLDENIIAFTHCDEKGDFNIAFATPEANSIKVSVSSLGYIKKETMLQIDNKSDLKLSLILEDKVETLSEIVINSDQKIKIDNDTTSIKVSSFINKTEQTIEDILKKIPGIEVQKDGSIKAHGKPIDKLLVEGEDMFDKNYKFLSRNLDAKVLDLVQIIDYFDDNPVLKRLNNSDKVAINLKLKKGLTNVWFGNITLGSGIVSENRWKESLSLGLLKKSIKLFYFGDYNNQGEKASEMITTNIPEKSNFSTDRFEYKTKSLYNIGNNEVEFFSKTQSIFNAAFLNSLSFTTKMNKKTSLRGVVYVVNDKQKQNSFSLTNYNLDHSQISFTEDNFYKSNKTLSSAELELKWYPNDKNYITNLFVFKDNPNRISNDLLFNTDQINQSLKTENYTFYNHFNHSYQVSANSVLNNYLYLGNDKIVEKTSIFSLALNSFFNANEHSYINQNVSNKLFYFGGVSKLISKFRKIDLTNNIQIEYSKEQLASTFLIDNLEIIDYQGILLLNQLKLVSDNVLRYNFSKKVDFTAGINLQNNVFDAPNVKEKIFIVNPTVSFNIKKTGFGNFSLSYSKNNTIPNSNQLVNNYQLVDYRSFLKGATYQNQLKNSLVSFNYYLFNDEKRFSISSGLFYASAKSIFNTETTLTNNLNFKTYRQTSGGNSYNFNFSFVNYIRKLKIASKIETTQMWNISPVNVNSNLFIDAKSYNNSIKYSLTTYFNRPINFDSGFTYNYNQSDFNGVKTNNTVQDFFLNGNYEISNELLVELNNSFYIVNNRNYSFNNIILNYSPKESKFSYRLFFNNIFNEKEYAFVSIDNYIYYQSKVQLVPRYLLLTAKYRF
ncbi:hypothetical protein ABGT15_06450 [Flavobacterium enshiense]|uniref:hypothetical protein n=1 Tax=Flavobacterium enshiense TaxID=1341165 RepID=UPI00345DE330